MKFGLSVAVSIALAAMTPNVLGNNIPTETMLKDYTFEEFLSMLHKDNDSKKIPSPHVRNSKTTLRNVLLSLPTNSKVSQVSTMESHLVTPSRTQSFCGQGTLPLPPTQIWLSSSE
jgi:hypothetical protein